MREERQAELEHGDGVRSTATRRKDQELRLARSADRTLVVSPIEKAVIEKECESAVDVRIMPTIYPVPAGDPPGFEDRRDIVFIGGFDHAPNIDAVLYFAREIFPCIRERNSRRCGISGAGSAPTHRRQSASSPQRPFRSLSFRARRQAPFKSCSRPRVAPIRYGAEVKGKVNQSMSFGVPTVVTSVAAEGMYLVHEQNAMIADDPASFANAVVRLWTSRELWQRVSQSGSREPPEKHFSVEAAAQPIDELLLWAGLPLLGADPCDSALLLTGTAPSDKSP